jgi:hypothetical protein
MVTTAAKTVTETETVMTAIEAGVVVAGEIGVATIGGAARMS